MTAQIIKSQKIVKTFSDTNYFAKGTYKRDYLELFSTSFIVNCFTKTVLAPLERWKIIKQTQTSYELRPNKLKNFMNFISKVKQDQGTKALWRGNSANLWLHFWQITSQVFLMDSIKSTFNEYAFELQNNPVLKGVLQRLIAPAFAAASCLLITHPIDTARVRISMNYYKNPKELLFTGITSCWSLIRLEQKSVKAIYRGYFIASLISILNLNIFSTVRDICNDLKLAQGQQQIVQLLSSGENVGILFSLLLLHPLDTIKKNLQLNNQSKPALFTNSLSVINYYKQSASLFKLYQGFTVTLIRQLLFWPIYALTLNQVDALVQKF